MLYSDVDLRREVANGKLCVDPFDEHAVQPSSVDMRLDFSFRVFQNHRYEFIDPSQEQGRLTHEYHVPVGTPFVLHPGEFALGSTFEQVAMPNYLAARLEGKSSLGRLGLMVHSTAGFIDPGFAGAITLELSNVSTLPIRLWPGMKIGQLCVFGLSTPAEHPYGSGSTGSRYQNQRGPTASRAWQNFDVADVYTRRPGHPASIDSLHPVERLR